MKVISSTIDLTKLEDIYKSAKRSKEHRDLKAFLELEEILNKIFKIANSNHENYSSNNFQQIPVNNLNYKVRDALNDAQLLQESLENLWRDSFQKVFNKSRYMFDLMNRKHLLNFSAYISEEGGTLKLIIRQFIPHQVTGDLYKIAYLMRKNSENCYSVSRIVDQSVRYLMVIQKSADLKEHFMKIKEIGDCHIMNRTLLCDPRDGTFDEKSNLSKCLKDLYKKEENYEQFCEFTLPNYNSTNCIEHE